MPFDGPKQPANAMRKSTLNQHSYSLCGPSIMPALQFLTLGWLLDWHSFYDPSIIMVQWKMTSLETSHFPLHHDFGGRRTINHPKTNKLPRIFLAQHKTPVTSWQILPPKNTWGKCGKNLAASKPQSSAGTYRGPRLHTGSRSQMLKFFCGDLGFCKSFRI